MASTEAELLALNDLDEPDTIIVGQQLVVPTFHRHSLPAAPDASTASRQARR
jgi:LysM repeat protein